ncbi:hypothetical protein [Spirosoma rhododendri]|uniref:Uncharacterized protein n=1 Tax=Spirosoma rhododendri TaxID=2728024 RepID=A0A7L5DM12_9BACT|nr:hypothetical protein [Spirosoma rhododendri]QJD79514.1 hypothetical protein HH216_14680 [Spirosoma rhododendri]
MENQRQLLDLLDGPVNSRQNDLALLSAQIQLEYAVTHFFDGIDADTLTKEDWLMSESIRHSMKRQASAIQELLTRRYGCND